MAGTGFVSGVGLSSHRQPAVVRPRRMVSMCEARREDPYQLLGLENRREATEREIRNAYLKFARKSHPDAVAQQGLRVAEEVDDFDVVTKAYELLSDPDRRQIFDDLGFDGLDALDTVRARASAQNMYEGIDPLELEQMMEMDRSTIAYLEMAESIEDNFDPESVEHEDFCPRTVEEGLWNLKHHPDLRCRYYTAWWLARFKVTEAEKTLVEVAMSTETTQPEFMKLRRRVIVALGKIAGTKPPSSATMYALGGTLNHADYNIRYNTCEALSKIADRNEGTAGFPQFIIDDIEEKLRAGSELSKQKRLGVIGQESLFNFEEMVPEVAAKLKNIIKTRKETMEESNRYNQTAGYSMDDLTEPWEKVIKAAADMKLFHMVNDVEEFVHHPVPLVRHAANKFLYIVKRDQERVESLCNRLDFGLESPLTQMVVCLDIGDLGYIPGAMRMVKAEGVASTIKLLGLVRMLDRNGWDTENPDLDDLFVALDDLIVS